MSRPVFYNDRAAYGSTSLRLGYSFCLIRIRDSIAQEPEAADGALLSAAAAVRTTAGD